MDIVYDNKIEGCYCPINYTLYNNEICVYECPSTTAAPSTTPPPSTTAAPPPPSTTAAPPPPSTTAGTPPPSTTAAPPPPSTTAAPPPPSTTAAPLPPSTTTSQWDCMDDGTYFLNPYNHSYEASNTLYVSYFNTGSDMYGQAFGNISKVHVIWTCGNNVLEIPFGIKLCFEINLDPADEVCRSGADMLVSQDLHSTIIEFARSRHAVPCS